MPIYQRTVDFQWSADRSEEARADTLAQLDQALKQAGGLRLVMVACSAEHALAEWGTFGFEVFPDEDSRVAFMAAVTALPGLNRQQDASSDFADLGLNQCLIDLE